MTFHYESRSFPGETTMDFYGYTSILIISTAKTSGGIGVTSPKAWDIPESTGCTELQLGN